MRLWKTELQTLADQAGLTVQCRLDENAYEKGTKVSDAQIASLNNTPADFHGEWNCTIAPQKPES